jgi:H(+)-transporting ATP synthase subunit D
MAVMRVNPTRMELTRLKKRLAIAVRGHKLLKDKRDEMIRRFIELVRRNKELREQVEKELNQALGDFLMARAVMSTEVLEEAVMYPTRQVELKISKMFQKSTMRRRARKAYPLILMDSPQLLANWMELLLLYQISYLECWSWQR